MGLVVRLSSGDPQTHGTFREVVPVFDGNFISFGKVKAEKNSASKK